MDFNHENGVDAATSTPNSDSNFGAVESKSQPDSNSVIAVPQPFSATEQAIEQLADLGYRNGDSVYLRALAPKGYGSERCLLGPDDGHSALRYWHKGRSAWVKQAHNLRLTIGADGGDGDRLDAQYASGQWRVKADGRSAVAQYLQALNQQGFGLYVVVNPGGHKAADITHANCVFWEHDDRSLAEQAEIFSQLRSELGGGGFAIETRSSLHCYLRLETSISIAKWAELQQRIIARLGSDRTLIDAPRLMRLAGFDHTTVVPADEPGQPYKIERVAIDYLHSWDGVATGLEAVEAAFPPLPEPALAPAPRQAPTNLSSGGGAIADFLAQQIYPRLGPEQIYVGNDLAKVGNRYQGKCPWHESKTGSAFWVKTTADGQTYRYACPTCTGNKTHGPVTYVHALRTGRHESPRGQDFIDAVAGLADKAGVGSEFAELVAGFGGAMGPVVHGVSLGLPDEAINGLADDADDAEPTGAVNLPAKPIGSCIPIAANKVLPTDPFAAFGMPSLADQLASAAAAAAAAAGQMTDLRRPSETGPTSKIQFDSQKLPITYSVPLEETLGKKIRDLLSGAAGDKANDKMKLLALTLAGTARYLDDVVQDYDGAPETLYQGACRACDPPLTDEEIAASWQAAQATESNRSASPGDIEKLVKAWAWANGGKAATEQRKKDTKPVPIDPSDSDGRPAFTSSPKEGLVALSYVMVLGDVIRVPTKIGNHLIAAAWVDSCEAENAGVRLEFKTKLGGVGAWTMPFGGLGKDPSEAISELMKRGYGYRHAERNSLVQYLVGLGDSTLAKYSITLKTGWVAAKDGTFSFALHSETIGDQSIRYLDVTPPTDPLIQRCGDIQGWQQTIGAMAAGNSRLIGAIGIALAAPLLKILGVEGGGLHIFGTSSIGKSTALAVSISVTGELRFATWNSTANGLEAGAEAHSDLLYPIDEVGQALTKVVEDASYCLANGVGKSRMSKDTSARNIKRWVTLFFSTGEFAMISFLQAGGIICKGGQESRMPSIPGDAGCGLGLFDTIHDWASPKEFADELKAQGPKNKGTVLAAFLERLVLVANDPTWVDRQKKRHQAIVKQLQGTASDPGETVGRVAGRFALIQLALELAQEWGVTLFPDGQVGWAVERLFTAWIEARGGAGSIDIKQACDRIEHLFVTCQHGDRIWDDANKERIVRSLLAYKVGGDFLVPAAVFRDEIAAGVDQQMLIAELRKRGWLSGPDSHGKSAHSKSINGGKHRVYVFHRFWENEPESGPPRPAPTLVKVGVPPQKPTETFTEKGSQPGTPEPVMEHLGVPAETVTTQGFQPTGTPEHRFEGNRDRERTKNKKNIFCSEQLDGHIEIDDVNADVDWTVPSVAY
jgi:putative DNA primase/helicase